MSIKNIINVLSIVSISWFCIPVGHAKNAVSIPIFTIESDITKYLLEVAHQALLNSEAKYGPIDVKFASRGTEEERQLRNLRTGINDVAFAVCSSERNATYQEIPVPLLGGLFGFRVAVIRSGATLLSDSNSLADIKRLIATQYESWVDYKILKRHGFTLLATGRQGGYRAVEVNIADYYPRSVLEVDSELEMFGNLGDFTIDDIFAIHYPLYYILYVEKNNQALAERLRYGLEVMVESGDFAQKMKQQQFYTDSERHLSGKQITELSNPFHSEACQQIATKYKSILFTP